MSWLKTTFAALRLRDFRILWIGTVCAHLAFFMSTVVQSVVAFELVGNNTGVGTVVFSQGLAMFVLGPLGGALADRWPKRLVIGLSQTIPALVFGTLAGAYATGSIGIGLVAGGAFLIGVTFAFLGPARQALIVDLVPPEKRGNAVALAAVASTASQMLGPGIAGVLLYWSLLGAAGAYGVMCGLYLISCALLLGLPRSRMRANAAETHVLADIIEGIRYVLQRSRLRLLVLLYVTVIMVGFPYVALMPAFIEHELGREAEAYAFLSLVSASGALAASLVVARYADHALATTLFGSMGLLFGAALMILATVPSFELAALSIFFVGFGFGGFLTLNNAVIVRATDPVFFGRVMSLTMLAFAAFGLMGLPVGMLADLVGERTMLTLTGGTVCMVVCMLAFMLVRTEDDAHTSSDS